MGRDTRGSSREAGLAGLEAGLVWSEAGLEAFVSSPLLPPLPCVRLGWLRLLGINAISPRRHIKHVKPMNTRGSMVK